MAPLAGSRRLTRARAEARACRRCPLWKHATQTVFGEGPATARVLVVGEQPGDREDLDGRPFVGPAGQLLRKALVEAGLDVTTFYVTNAVKHFKWEPRGKRRIHKRPNQLEILACRHWLEEEVAAIAPRLILALGATAAAAIAEGTVRVTRDRGQLLPSTLGPPVTVTVHPSSILRQPDAESRRREYERFVDDLRAIARMSQKA
jgi:DNA polymerase